MSIKSFIFDLGVKASKHVPTVLVVGGIGVGVAAAVIAVKKTPALHEIYREDKEKMKEIDEMVEDPSAKIVVEQGATDDEPTLYAPYDEDVAEADRKELVRHMVGHTVRTYALPIGMGLLSASMILLGYKMKCRALLAMTASYNASVAAFRTYRKRVADKYGEDAERDIYLGRSTEVVENVDENGNITVEEHETLNPIQEEIVLVFDSTCREWRNDPSYIKQYLDIVQRNCDINYQTRSTKHLYLMELIDAMGMPREQRYSGKGFSEIQNPERTGIDITTETRIVKENGEYVAYIPVNIDGSITI